MVFSIGLGDGFDVVEDVPTSSEMNSSTFGNVASGKFHPASDR